MKGAQTCLVCGKAELGLLIDFGTVPRSGIFLQGERDIAPKRPLSFYYCRDCGFVGQHRSRSIEVDYTEVARATRRQLPHYADETLERLRSKPGWRHGLIIEVGANDGTFLDLLALNGHELRLGIEPSRVLSDICASRGHRVETCHLTSTTAPQIRARHGAANAIVCRHTLEHVPDPLELLAAMRLLLKEDGVLFIDVPALFPIVDHLWGFELWDEHLSYFSTHTLARLLHKAGYSVTLTEAKPHRGSTNILCWAKLSEKLERLEDDSTVARTAQLCERFGSRWNAYCNYVRAQVGKAPEPVFAIGASHPQSNYLNFTGLGTRVATLVDDDPLKIGRYVPLPQPTRVVETKFLLQQVDSAIVLLTGFGYPAWMADIRHRLASKRVRFVDPIADLARY